VSACVALVPACAALVAPVVPAAGVGLVSVGVVAATVGDAAPDGPLPEGPLPDASLAVMLFAVAFAFALVALVSLDDAMLLEVVLVLLVSEVAAVEELLVSTVVPVELEFVPAPAVVAELAAVAPATTAWFSVVDPLAPLAVVSFAVVSCAVAATDVAFAPDAPLSPEAAAPARSMYVWTVPDPDELSPPGGTSAWFDGVADPLPVGLPGVGSLAVESAPVAVELESAEVAPPAAVGLGSVGWVTAVPSDGSVGVAGPGVVTAGAC
jgi:hypothetical protein